MIEDNTSFKMVKEICFYHNYKLNYDLRNALYSGVLCVRLMPHLVVVGHILEKKKQYY